MNKKDHSQDFPELNPEEDKHADNMLKALSIDMDFDGISYISDNAPPEIVSAFLDNVRSFEEKHRDAPKITVRARLGDPDIRPFDGLSEDECGAEVDRLVQLMQQHGIVLILPEHLNARGQYRFLEKDVLDYQITDHSAEGMLQTIDYNDFHQDSPQFMEAHVEEFLWRMLDLDTDFEPVWLYERCRDATMETDKYLSRAV